MDLVEEIEDLQGYYDRPPSNEAETRECVIRPLLRAAGYSAKDMRIEQVDQNKKRPDYSILWSEPEHGWFLEAKAWRSELRDDQVHQALNYANQNGKRWVVLTNGNEWRLYDNDLRGLPAQKLVRCAKLSETHALSEMLRALSPSAIRTGETVGFATACREAKFQEETLTKVSHAIAGLGDETSEVTDLLVRHLSDSIPGVTPRHIVESFSRFQEHQGTEPVVGASTSSQSEFGTDWTPEYAQLRSFAEALVREDRSFAVDITWKRGVCFFPSKWGRVLPATEFREWSPSGYPVLVCIDTFFEFPGICVKLIIGPAPDKVRARVFDIAQRSRILQPRRRKISRKWDTIYKRNLLTLSGDMNQLEAEQLLRSAWREFLETDFTQIETEMLRSGLAHTDTLS